MSRFIILESSLPDGSERVLWFRSKIMSSISPISKTFFRLQSSDERKRKGFLLPLLMLVLLLLNEVDPDVGMGSVGWREGGDDGRELRILFKIQEKDSLPGRRANFHGV